MVTRTVNIARQFKDLDLKFTIHPVRKDISKHTGELAIINALKNLILTNHYERPFQPDLGCNVRKLLFENFDVITASALEREIELTIRNFEPRVSLNKVKARTDFNNNRYLIELEFFIVNLTEPISIQFFLERLR